MFVMIDNCVINLKSIKYLEYKRISSEEYNLRIVFGGGLVLNISCGPEKIKELMDLFYSYEKGDNEEHE